jgi:hypothetical protein
MQIQGKLPIFLLVCKNIRLDCENFGKDIQGSQKSAGQKQPVPRAAVAQGGHL